MIAGVFIVNLFFIYIFIIIFYFLFYLHLVPGVSQTVYKITPKNVVARQEDVPNFIVGAGCYNCCNCVGCLGC